MSHKLFKVQKQAKQTVWDELWEYFCGIMNIVSCLYLLFIIVVIPCYAPEGHVNMATHKENLFIYFAKWFLPAFGIFALVYLLRLIVQLVNTRAGHRTAAGAGSMQRPPAALPFCRETFSVTDCFAFGYLCVLVISYLFSPYRETALWGTGGWRMGFLTQVTFVGSYFLISRTWKPGKWLLALMLPVSAFLYLLGILNRFNIYPLDMQLRHSLFLSLTGNINWYCGYLVILLFGAVCLYWLDSFKNRILRVCLFVYITLGFLALTTQGSSSGLLTLGAVLFVLFLLSCGNSSRMKQLAGIILSLGLACFTGWLIRTLAPDAITWEEASINLMTKHVSVWLFLLFLGTAALLLTHITASRGCYPVRTAKLCSKIVLGIALAAGTGLAVLLCMNTLHPGSIGALSRYSFFTFSPEWGSKRGATWMAGLICFREQTFLHRLIGVGPDCMADYIQLNGSAALQAMLEEQFGSRLTNAHNEWITVLVNCGLTGLICFAGMTVSAVVRFFPPRPDSFCTKAPGNNAAKKPSDRPCISGRKEPPTLQTDFPRHIAAACGLALFAYTVHNTVSFEQILNVPTMYVFLGIGERCLRHLQQKAQI